jgi:S-adenosylmethionine hydrolase
VVSDFGRKDPYAGVMAGSALSAAPAIRLVEVTHEVPAFNVRHGAWIVGQVVDAFPPGATILAVVDPGVGSSRPPVAVQCREGDPVSLAPPGP